GAVVHPGEEAAVGAAVDDVGIVGIGHDVSALAPGGLLPVVERNSRSGRAAEDAQRRVVLLRAEDAVREVVVRGDPVDLRGRLVVLRRPGAAAVDRDVHAAVVRLDHAQGIAGVDPQVVIVAVRRADGGEGPAAVLRTVKLDVDHVDGLFVPGIGIDPGVIPGALAQRPVLVGAGPGRAAVLRAEHAALLGLDDGVEVVGVARRDVDADDAESALGQAGLVRQLGPGVAAVGALPQPRARAATLQAVRGTPHAPERGIEDARIGRVHRQVDGARVAVDEVDALPGLAAVLRAVDAAHVVGTEEVAEDRGVDQVRVFRVDADARDDPRVVQAGVLPGAAGVGRLPDAVALGHVAADGLFAGAGVDHVRISRRDRDGADRAAEGAVRHVLPGAPPVRGLPDAAAGAAEIVGVALARDAGHRRRPAAAIGADLAPAVGLPELGVENLVGPGCLLRFRRGRGGGEIGGCGQRGEHGQGEREPGEDHAQLLKEWMETRTACRSRPPRRTLQPRPDAGRLRIVVELLQRQAAGIEEVEHRLLDDLGEVEEEGAVLLDPGLAGLDLLVLFLGDLELLGHLVDRLLPLLAMFADQLAGLALLGVGRLAAVGEQARGGGLELDGDLGEEGTPFFCRRSSAFHLAIFLLWYTQPGSSLVKRELLPLSFLLQNISEFHRPLLVSWLRPAVRKSGGFRGRPGPRLPMARGC